VHGILIEFLSRLDDVTNLKEILYDDCCHLKAFCEKDNNAEQNDMTKYLAEVGKHVEAPVWQEDF
jgi:hypothetical protein